MATSSSFEGSAVACLARVKVRVKVRVRVRVRVGVRVRRPWRA